MAEKQTFVLNAKKIKQNLNQKYPIGYIPRQKIKEATGGILIPQTMSNRDCGDDGIKGAIRIGLKICYPIDGVIEYLEERVKLLNVA